MKYSGFDMMKKVLTYWLLLYSVCSFSQTYNPVSVTGFNLDAVAEAYPNSLSCTTQALDQVVAGGNSVMYSAAFGAAAAFGGGLPNSGTIVNGTKTFQLMPYTGNNVLFAPASSTNTLALVTAASYSSLSFLVFSTEGSSTFNITVHYTDLTFTNAGNFTVQDWFNGTGAVISGIGRCKRVASGVTNDGLPTNPMLYGIDVPISCANQQKLISHVVVNGISSNPAGGGGYILAVSGVTANVVPPSIAYGSPLCQGGASATPTITGTAGGTFSSAPAGLSIAAATGILNLAASTAATYSVTYTTPGTCALSTTYSLVVVASPTILVNSPTVCAGETATLSASGATSYTWAGYGLSGASGPTVSANAVATGIYTLTGSSNGCTTTTTSTLRVNPLPVVSADPVTICPGATAVLTATASIAGGNYVWLPGNQTSSSITESPSSSSSYTVTYTVNSCSASAVAAVSIQTVSLLSVNSGSVCSGEAIVLTANPSVAGGTYVWQPGGATTASVSKTLTSPASYTVQYTVNGCSVSAVSQVGIYPNPDAALNPSAPSVAPLDEVSIVASGGSSYVWNTGATGAEIHVKPLETSTYCATVTSTQGCRSEACVEILVKEESTLYMPDAFTPNGDGLNDEYCVLSYNLLSFDLKIYNRWGQLLFQTNDPGKCWDGSFKGQAVPVPDVYVFILSAKGNDGTYYRRSERTEVWGKILFFLLMK